MNIVDIAKLAGVSIATVSRVLNGTARVRPETRERVMAVVEQHRYTPNALARGLIQSKTGTIGILTVDILNPYYASVTHHTEQRLRELGFTTFLCNTGDSTQEKESYIRTLMENRVDGLIFVGSTFRSDHSDHLLEFAADVLPTVLINGSSSHTNCSCVVCDDESGIELALDHLARSSRSILFVGTIRTASGRRKMRSFQRHTQEKEIEDARLILTSDHTVDLLPSRLDRLYRRKPFNAVLASDDLFAHAVLAWARSSDIRVPKSLRVSGYNDSQIATYAIPALTTVNSRMDALGRLAADRIDERIRGTVTENETIYLEPFLVKRNST